MSIFQPNNQAITFNQKFTAALSFRAKLLLAMMLVALTVTTAAVYLAEKNRESNHQQLLDAQFQNRVQAFLKIQEAQSAGITEKRLRLSHAGRLRAGLEQRDVDDLSPNALTGLHGKLHRSRTTSPKAPGRTAAASL